MLAILAAVVPITASLYVAGSMLAEYAERDHTARVAARVWARYNSERAQLEDLPPRELAPRNKAITERRMRLLELNGVDPWVGTLRRMGGDAQPQPMPRVEIRRQWVLLLGSAAGVVLLALDAL
ncbi:hypothetical protein ACWGR3_28885 [Streptomyces albidoflavus]